MMRFSFSFTASTLKSCCTIFALLLSSLFFSATAIYAQGGEDGGVVKVNTTLVQLNVGVVDRQGHPVTNLSRNDFAVYEDNVLQPISDFEPTTTPFSLVLLLDLSGSTLTFRQTLKQAAYRFLDALTPEDRVAVVVFYGDKIKTISDFTTDRSKTGKAIEYADGKGETHFFDALKYSLTLLGQEGKRRKAIVTLTDGIDTEMQKQDRMAAAKAKTNDEALASVKPDASAQLNAVLSAADRQGVAIYPLALPSGDPKHLPFAEEPVQVAIYNAARVRLQALADRTGGQLSEIHRLEEMGRLYNEIAAELRTLYTIAYSPRNDKAAPGPCRTIRIEVSQPELIARSKTGYCAR